MGQTTILPGHLLLWVMPYPPDHKPRTRRSIVQAAAALFGERGYRQTSVQRVMQAAGLTHGGFYAHFRDKADLFAAALEEAFEQARDKLLARGLEDLRGPEWVQRASRRYLSLRHRAAPAEGCAIPSLAAEATRESESVQAAFEAGLESMIDGMTERLDGDRAQALRLLALWSGALGMSRAVGDELAQEILQAARDAHL